MKVGLEKVCSLFGSDTKRVYTLQLGLLEVLDLTLAIDSLCVTTEQRVNYVQTYFHFLCNTLSYLFIFWLP